MKYSSEELLLAVQVRALAAEIREVALQRAQEKWQQEQLQNFPKNSDLRPAISAMEGLRQKFRLEWFAAHPITEFAALALAEVEKMAEFIRNSSSK